VFATAAVGPDGVPAIVQREADRFAGKHVRLKPGSQPTAFSTPVVIRRWVGHDGSEYTFNGRGVFISLFPGPPGPAVRPGDTPLSDDRLTEQACSYVRRHFDARQAAWPATVTRRVAGTDQNGRRHREIHVELRELVAGLPSPNFIRLHLDLEGDVLDFIRDDGPVSVTSTTARISKEQAVSVAAKAAHFEKAKVTSAELRIERDAWGATGLVWRLELDDATPAPDGSVRLGGHAWVSVDATRGEILSRDMSR
jgi:hypothetical protein